MIRFTQLAIFFFLWSYGTGNVWGQVPLHNYVVILLDSSGSMKQSDPQFLRREATKLLITLLRPGDRIVLAEFGDGVRSLTEGAMTLSPETQHSLFKITDNLSSKDKFTDILGACQYAVTLIAALPMELRQSFAPTVILLTDGKDEMPDQGDRGTLIEAKIKELAKLGAKVHAVGFPGKSDMKILEQAANLTGGDLWVIHRPSDLLRGFFGLSRVMGNRWPLEEQSVNRGPLTISLPGWARRLVVCYLPALTTSERVQASTPITQEITTPSYQILRFERVPASRLELTLPTSGTLLVDAEETLLIQTGKGRKAPARLPFPFHAYLTPAQGGELGQPHFLKETAFMMRLYQEGQTEVSLPLYDDGQHEDGAPRDGRFGGFVSGLREGLWHYRLTARTPYSPTLSLTGQLEVLATPLAISPPGTISRLVLTPFTGRLDWQVCNLTDFPLRGEVIVTPDQGVKTSQPLSWKGGDCQKVSVPLARDWRRGATGQVALRLSRQPEPLWQGKYYLRPLWMPVATFLGVIGLLILTFIFPRRSPQGSTLTVTATVAGKNIVRILRVGHQGRVEASDLPHPINDPGSFRARSGLWRRGIVYEPAPWCQPHFPGKRPPRKGRGFLLQGPATWRCVSETIHVEYRLSPRF